MVRELGFGGTERQITELAKALDPARFQVTVGAFLTEGVRGDELRDAGIAVERFPVRSFKPHLALPAAWQMRHWLRRHRIEIFHAFDYPAAIFGVPVARWAGVPVVLSSQRGERILFPPLSRRMLGWTDPLVDGIVANCEHLRTDLVQHYGVAREKIHVCYNGIDTELFHAEGRSEPQDTLTIGTIAVLRPEKSLHTLIDAFSRLPGNHRLRIVGEGPCRGELEAAARPLGERCRFAGAATNVVDWYRQMDLFVLPTVSEALSNSILEAMACGCVPVATAVGGNPELVRDGDNGFLFPVGDAAALTARLRTLIEDPELRQRMARRSRQRVLDEFTRPRMAARMSEIYQQFSGNQTTGRH